MHTSINIRTPWFVNRSRIWMPQTSQQYRLWRKNHTGNLRKFWWCYAHFEREITDLVSHCINPDYNSQYFDTSIRTLPVLSCPALRFNFLFYMYFFSSNTVPLIRRGMSTNISGTLRSHPQWVWIVPLHSLSSFTTLCTSQTT